MDSWDRPNAFDLRTHVSESRHAANLNRQEEYHQEQSDVLVSRASSLPPRAPAPVFLPNQPALWQLGRHSWYKYGEDEPQHPSDGYESSASPNVPTFFTRADAYPYDVKQVPYGIEDTTEAHLRDVEAELHRGLKARQVRDASNS